PEAPQSPEQAPLSHVPALEYSEYLAPSDDDIPTKDQPLLANASPIAYYVPSSEETKPFKIDESATTPPLPHTIVSLSQTGLRRVQKTVQPQPPLPAAIEARIAEYGSAPTPPLPPPSLLSPLSYLLPKIPSPPLLLPPTRPLHTSPTY
nr:hypothetical protein [Tanacetum cinerariifolium]